MKTQYCFICGAPMGVVEGGKMIPVPLSFRKIGQQVTWRYICGDCLANAEDYEEDKE